jgi:UDP-4-amino-4,6-dideoxy-N-acetyl-beta-L-altrosamine transaminase
MPPFLPYGKQLVEDDDVAAVAEALRGDFLTTGPSVAAFEEAFAARVGTRHAVSCANGTAALHLTALALGLKPGDRTIVPAITFLATANCARYVGADVTFADVDPSTALMTEASLEEALARAGSAAKAVYPVHMNGQTVDMAAIAKRARVHDLAIVEDACHALGGVYRGADGVEAKVGSCRHSDMAIFSFHPVKIIACGEGGMVTTNDDALAASLRRHRSHGMVREPDLFEDQDQAFGPDGAANPWYYEMPEPGFNYRLSDIHAALGLSQLKKLDRFAAQRRELVAIYDRALAPYAPVLRPLARTAHDAPGWHLYVALIDFARAGVSRGACMRAMGKAGVGSQVHYLPLHRQPYYRRRYGAMSLPGAECYYAEALSLPLSAHMAEDDVNRVVRVLTAALGLDNKTGGERR